MLSIDAIPSLISAIAAGEANATVELTPNMAGPAVDAHTTFRKLSHRVGTLRPKVIIAGSRLFAVASNPAGACEARKVLGYWIAPCPGIRASSTRSRTMPHRSRPGGGPRRHPGFSAPMRTRGTIVPALFNGPKY